jgi:hypothetical protein
MTSSSQSPEWESRFDDAVRLVSERQLSAALQAVKKLRTWQGRGGWSNADHPWHRAELLWLEGVALERASRSRQAEATWQTLLELVRRERASPSGLLRRCATCASRRLPFAKSWYETARDLEYVVDDEVAAFALLRAVATAEASDA